MDKWLDAKSSPPEQDGEYLACCGNIFIATYNKRMDKWERRDGNPFPGVAQAVTYWMPLPNRPKN